jgi:hypothetical protein
LEVIDLSDFGESDSRFIVLTKGIILALGTLFLSLLRVVAHLEQKKLCTLACFDLAACEVLVEDSKKQNSVFS